MIKVMFIVFGVCLLFLSFLVPIFFGLILLFFSSGCIGFGLGLILYRKIYKRSGSPKKNGLPDLGENKN